MSQNTLWISLIAGFLLFLYGLKLLYQQGDWGLMIISILIMAFSASSLIKHRAKP